MGGQRPKTLLPLEEHPPLLHFILRGLTAAGVDDLLVVTGFEPQQVQDFVAESWDGRSQFVRNTRYASWGNFHSVRMAIDQSPGYDLLVVNSDVIVHPEVFERAIARDGELVLAVQRRYRLDAEDMKVRIQRGRVTSIGKQLDRALAQGEFCGVSLLRPVAAHHYLEHATALEWMGDVDRYYEDVYDLCLPRVDARAAEVNEGEYAEVDEPGDVPAAAAVASSVADAEPQPAATS